MTPEELREKLAHLSREQLPLPGAGSTAQRHKRLLQVGREDLSLAKLAEAHWDAVAILAEAGRQAESGTVYGVWASEIPGRPLHLESSASGYRLSGEKMFCSGAGLVQRALITTGPPEDLLIDLGLVESTAQIAIDPSRWQTEAFRSTCTATVRFDRVEVDVQAVVGSPHWYVDRPGFWHGACGPAACWGGGVAGLVDFADSSSKADPHTAAHLAAMHANVWAIESFLEIAGREIDRHPQDRVQAEIRALQVRHLVEQACSDLLLRFARAYGPYPLCMNAETSRRYSEAQLYLRQCHGERDLESLGRTLKQFLKS